MTQFTPLIICNENNESNTVSSVLDFDNKEIDLFGFNNQQVLESIISNILTNPKVLQTHIQRIYFCYQYDLADDLFAALVDFLIVLEGKGQQIQSRMVNGAKPKLHLSHYAILKNALKLPANKVKLLKGNLYSVLTQGLIGVSVIIEKETQKHKFNHDPLDLARDYVAYSQLDMAMKTLEDAIMLDFERSELHYDLLELYKLTHSEDKFLIMYAQLSKQFQSIPSAWEKLKGFFYA